MRRPERGRTPRLAGPADTAGTGGSVPGSPRAWVEWDRDTRYMRVAAAAMRHTGRRAWGRRALPKPPAWEREASDSPEPVRPALRGVPRRDGRNRRNTGPMAVRVRAEPGPAAADTPGGPRAWAPRDGHCVGRRASGRPPAADPRSTCSGRHSGPPRAIPLPHALYVRPSPPLSGETASSTVCHSSSRGPSAAGFPLRTPAIRRNSFCVHIRGRQRPESAVTIKAERERGAS